MKVQKTENLGTDREGSSLRITLISIDAYREPEDEGFKEHIWVRKRENLSEAIAGKEQPPAEVNYYAFGPMPADEAAQLGVALITASTLALQLDRKCV